MKQAYYTRHVAMLKHEKEVYGQRLQCREKHLRECIQEVKDAKHVLGLKKESNEL